MPISIGIESPLQADVGAMIDGLNAHLIPLSPLEFQYKMTAEELAGDDVVVFVARNGSGEALGMGALKAHGAHLGEVKRMFTYPKARGQRIGRKILEAIKTRAQGRGMAKLVLETGIGEGYDAAWRLYENFGFKRCGPVLDYKDSVHSAFFELRMGA